MQPSRLSTVANIDWLTWAKACYWSPHYALHTESPVVFNQGSLLIHPSRESFC